MTRAAPSGVPSALELDPYVRSVGRLHERSEEWVPAEQAYERALELLPSFYEAALALADLLRRVGRVRHAVTRLATLLEQDP